MQKKWFISSTKLMKKPIDNLLKVLDEFRKSQLYGFEFLHTVTELLHNAGIRFGASIDTGLDRALSNLDDYTEAFKLVPVMWEDIPPPAGAPLACAGVAPSYRRCWMFW